MKRLMMCAATAIVMACATDGGEFGFDEMSYTPSATVFKLFAPADARCSVVVGGDTLAMTAGHAMDGGAVWTATAHGDRKGQDYVFLVTPRGADSALCSPGVAARAVTVNGQRGVVVDMRDTDPEGWADDDRRLTPMHTGEALVVYEMHHRDFSIARADARHPGKFLALTEPWAIEHLTRLGVTAVHLLPSYDFGSVDETRLDEPQYNWGYDPVNYNVPEGSYSTDPYDPLARIREFKQMVLALHQAGIAVILDVVYNHTYDTEHSNFQRTFPGYYYRLCDDGTFSNGSGCGNETASERPMMRRFMTESVRYWHDEYHIDGFRFDLMGCHDVETMNHIRAEADKMDSTIFIYGEGWSAGQCALPAERLATKANIGQMPRVAAFSDELRDALRGPFDDDTRGAFLAGLAGSEESVKAGIAGMVEHGQVDYSKVNYTDRPWASEPTQMMAYVSCHDDMCLTDRLRASIDGIGDDELTALDLLAQTAVMTSQGVPFMLSGEELLRTKQGVHNSFESPDSVNRLDWSNLERHPQVFDYYRGLIALRRHHRAFRLGSAELVRRHLEFLPADSCVVAFRLKDHAGGDPWQDIVVVLNANREARTVAVPEGRYTVVCCDGQIDEQGLGGVNGAQVVVGARSALVMYRP